MPRIAFLLVIILLQPGLAAAQQPASPAPAADDPFVWLEDVEGARSMEWVNAKTAATVADLSASTLYQPVYDGLKGMIGTKENSAYPEIIGNSLYNFWKDAENERGICLMTT